VYPEAVTAADSINDAFDVASVVWIVFGQPHGRSVNVAVLPDEGVSVKPQAEERVQLVAEGSTGQENCPALVDEVRSHPPGETVVSDHESFHV